MLHGRTPTLASYLPTQPGVRQRQTRWSPSVILRGDFVPPADVQFHRRSVSICSRRLFCYQTEYRVRQSNGPVLDPARGLGGAHEIGELNLGRLQKWTFLLKTVLSSHGSLVQWAACVFVADLVGS